MLTEPVNGHRSHRIQLIEIEVVDNTVRWQDWPAWPTHRRKASNEAELGATEQRCSSVNLLVGLLRHHSDLQRPDQISPELYGELLKVAGHELFDLLFVGDLRNRVASALDRFSEDEIDLLRVKLSFRGQRQTWLAGLPWEYVHTPPGDERFDPAGVFLFHQAELMLSRNLESHRARQLGDRGPLKVLLVCPNPTSPAKVLEADERIEPVDPARVIKKFEQLQAAEVIRLATLIDDAPDYPVEHPTWVTRDALKAAVREERPVIVHFLGHGRSYHGSGQLLLSNADGTPHWISAQEFSRTVERSCLKLVFLQACESNLPDPYVPFSGVAMRLAASGLPAVVAMQYRIKAELATAFTEAFYDELLRQNSAIDVAVEAGRERIDGQMDERDRLAFGLPVVYLASHEGMLIDEPLQKGQETVERGTVRVCPNPECGVRQRRADAKFCFNCTLRLRCHACDFPIGDPLNDTACDECGAKLHRAAGDSAPERTSPLPEETAVLSVLGGPRGEEQ